MLNISHFFRPPVIGFVDEEKKIDTPADETTNKQEGEDRPNDHQNAQDVPDQGGDNPVSEQHQPESKVGVDGASQKTEEIISSVDPLADLGALAGRLDRKTIDEDIDELNQIACEITTHCDYLLNTADAATSESYREDSFEKLALLRKLYVDDRREKANAPADGPADPLADLVALAARLDGKTVEEDQAEIRKIMDEVTNRFIHLRNSKHHDFGAAEAYKADSADKIALLWKAYVADRCEEASFQQPTEDGQVVGSQSTSFSVDEVPLVTVSIADLNPKVIMYNADTGQALGAMASAMAEAMIRSGAVKAP